MVKEIIQPLRELLSQLQRLLMGLDDGEYERSIAVLSEASLGQHTRHIIEFFTELLSGYEKGHINYDLRSRDKRIETDRLLALTALKRIIEQVDKGNKSLQLESDFSFRGDVSSRVSTNFERELIYNIEHAIHHMALMRIGVEAISDLKLPENFGMASSTLRYRKSGKGSICYR